MTRDEASAGNGEVRRKVLLGSAPLPSPNFQDAEELARWTEDFERLGASKKHAQWLALRMKSDADMDAAFEIARDADLLDVWASGAAAISPEAAFELLRSLPQNDREKALSAFFAALGQANPETGLAFLERLPNPRFEPVHALIAGWASVASVQEVARAIERFPAQIRDMAINGLFKVWDKSDREGMLDWAEALGPRYGKRAFMSLYEPGGIRNPDDVVELASQFPKSATWYTVAAASEQLTTDALAGFESVKKLPPGVIREDILRRFAMSHAERDPASAWELMETLSAEEQAQFLESGLRRFVKVAPQETAERLKAGDAWHVRSQELFSAWAEVDASQALEWARENLAGKELLEAMNTIYSSWPRDTAGKAAQALEGLPASLRARLLPSAATAFGAADPEAALAWAHRLSHVERMRGVDAVVSGWAETDAVAAANALAAGFAEGSGEAFLVVGRKLVGQDPIFATKWASELNSDTIRNDVISAVVEAWGSHDAAGASEYLADLPTGGFRDRAIEGFVGSVRGLDPESAAVWADTIEAPERRRANIEQALRAWRAHDRDAARKFVRGIHPESLREEMMKFVEQ